MFTKETSSLEVIIASVVSKLKTTEGEEFATYKQLNQKLSLGIDIHELLEGDTTNSQGISDE